MRGLYVILDVETCAARGIPPLAFAEAVLAVRPAALQLRAKDLTAREILALLRALAPRCHAARVPLVCNDRPDLAVLAGADMVHLGQDDAPVDLVRRLSPGIRIGISTHTLDQLARALEARPDYVAFGPVYPTASKKQPDAVVGLVGLSAAAALVTDRAALGDGASRIPLVAIGGITESRATDIVSRADAGAVIAALFGNDAGSAGAREIRRRAAILHAALGGERRSQVVESGEVIT